MSKVSIVAEDVYNDSVANPRKTNIWHQIITACRACEGTGGRKGGGKIDELGRNTEKREKKTDSTRLLNEVMGRLQLENDEFKTERS